LGSGSNRPMRKMTPRSYSRSTLRELKSQIRMTTIANNNTGIISMRGPFLTQSYLATPEDAAADGVGEEFRNMPDGRVVMRSGSDCPFLGQSCSTSIFNPCTLVTRTRAPVGMGLFENEFQYSPCTRTFPSANTSVLAIPVSPIIASSPTIDFRRCE